MKKQFLVNVVFMLLAPLALAMEVSELKDSFVFVYVINTLDNPIWIRIKYGSSEPNGLAKGRILVHEFMALQDIKSPIEECFKLPANKPFVFQINKSGNFFPLAFRIWPETYKPLPESIVDNTGSNYVIKAIDQNSLKNRQNSLKAVLVKNLYESALKFNPETNSIFIAVYLEDNGSVQIGSINPNLFAQMESLTDAILQEYLHEFSQSDNFEQKEVDNPAKSISEDLRNNGFEIQEHQIGRYNFVCSVQKNSRGKQTIKQSFAPLIGSPCLPLVSR